MEAVENYVTIQAGNSDTELPLIATFWQVYFVTPEGAERLRLFTLILLQRPSGEHVSAATTEPVPVPEILLNQMSRIKVFEGNWAHAVAFVI